MKKGWKYALAILMAFLCLYGALLWTTKAKDETIDDAYRTAQETLRATELTQYINNLEFGLRYGKKLDNYYNMDKVLESILRSSPYIEGAYIVDNGAAMLYQAGEPLPSPEEFNVLHNGEQLYVSSQQFGYAFMFMDIHDDADERAGTLIVMLNNDIMNTLISSYQQEGHGQSWVILAEALLLFIIIFGRMDTRSKKRITALSVAILLSFTVLAAQAADIAIEGVKLSVKVQTITSQSVQKIAQVLQQQVADVMDKGVAVEDMYDVYGWLDDIDEKLDSVDGLEFTEEGRVRAEMDEEHLTRTVIAALMQMVVKYLMLAAVCTVGCAAVGGAETLLRRRRQREEEAYALSA